MYQMQINFGDQNNFPNNLSFTLMKFPNGNTSLLAIMLLPPPSQHFQWFPCKNIDIHIDRIHSSLVPVPCPKTEFSISAELWQSHGASLGVLWCLQFKGPWPLPAEGKFKLLVNFGIIVDVFQPWQTFKPLWPSICHWKTSANLFREERWCFTQDAGEGIRQYRFFPQLCCKALVWLCQPVFKCFNSPSIKQNFPNCTGVLRYLKN